MKHFFLSLLVATLVISALAEYSDEDLLDILSAEDADSFLETFEKRFWKKKKPTSAPTISPRKLKKAEKQRQEKERRLKLNKAKALKFYEDTCETSKKIPQRSCRPIQECFADSGSRRNSIKPRPSDPSDNYLRPSSFRNPSSGSLRRSSGSFHRSSIDSSPSSRRSIRVKPIPIRRPSESSRRDSILSRRLTDDYRRNRDSYSSRRGSSNEESGSTIYRTFRASKDNPKTYRTYSF
ncbi:hypothetical protein SNEBB_000276 [Seison nebaliae]|nr:hypothetical protein SNEBB_000276 [Seison nebaliae]